MDTLTITEAHYTASYCLSLIFSGYIGNEIMIASEGNVE
jgi:hypothetical protein